jgi:hypothetical protein
MLQGIRLGIVAREEANATQSMRILDPYCAFYRQPVYCLGVRILEIVLGPRRWVLCTVWRMHGIDAFIHCVKINTTIYHI